MHLLYLGRPLSSMNSRIAAERNADQVVNPNAPGLTNTEAAERLATDRANTVADAAVHPLHDVISKCWAPVPWLLEAAVILQLVLHDYTEALIVFGLLAFNAVLDYFESSRAQETLAALKSRLASTASVRPKVTERRAAALYPEGRGAVEAPPARERSASG